MLRNEPVSVGRLSSQVPRRQAAETPISVPITNARIVTMPTRPIVYGRAVDTMLDTDCG